MWTALGLGACASSPPPAATVDANGGSDTKVVADAADAAADGQADAAAEVAAETAQDAVADAAPDASADAPPPADVLADAAPDAAPEAVADGVETAVADASTNPSDCKLDFADTVAMNFSWKTFKVVKGAGPCPPGQVCQWSWSIGKELKIAKVAAGVASDVALTQAQFDEISKSLSLYAFGTQMAKGFVCGQPPTDISVTFEAVAGYSFDGDQNKTYVQDVTGCIYGSAACNDARAVWELVSQY